MDHQIELLDEFGDKHEFVSIAIEVNAESTRPLHHPETSQKENRFSVRRRRETLRYKSSKLEKHSSI